MEMIYLFYNINYQNNKSLTKKNKYLNSNKINIKLINKKIYTKVFINIHHDYVINFHFFLLLNLDIRIPFSMIKLLHLLSSCIQILDYLNYNAY